MHPPEKQQHCLGEGLEIIVAVDFCGIVQRNFTKHLAEKQRSFQISPAKSPNLLSPVALGLTLTLIFNGICSSIKINFSVCLLYVLLLPWLLLYHQKSTNFAIRCTLCQNKVSFLIQTLNT